MNSYEVFRYDVKDSPDGYLLRTNYSVSGRPNEGYGYIRYDNAARLFSRATSERSITPEWITGICSRSFYHTLLGRDFTTDTWVVDQDFIPRRSTSASVVIEGVKSGESPVIHYHVDDVGDILLLGRVAGVDRLRVWCSDPVARVGRFCALSVVRVVEPIEK